MIDPKDIEKEVKLALKSKVEAAIAEADILNLISKYIEPMINEKIDLMVNSVITTMSQRGKFDAVIEKQFASKFDQVLTDSVRNKVNDVSNSIDMGTAISNKIEFYIENRMKQAALPKAFIPIDTIKWDNASIPANVIAKGVIKDFESTGIKDTALENELTISENVVVVENNLVAKSAEIVDEFVSNHTTVNTLHIDGKLTFSTPAAMGFFSSIQEQINSSIASIKYDIADKALYSGDTMLLNPNGLGPSIVTSNLRKVGRLTDLDVTGPAQFNQTMYVSDAGTVGINTTDPEGVLTVWDQETDLSVKKYKNKTMYIGSHRDTDLFFGINNNIHLTITKDGVVGLNKLNFGGIPISIGTEIPTHKGTPGELVIMSNAGESDPWAYRSLGGGKWVAVR